MTAAFLVVKITDKSQKQSENIHFPEVMYDFHQSHTSISNTLMRFFFFFSVRTELRFLSFPGISKEKKKKGKKKEFK